MTTWLFGGWHAQASDPRSGPTRQARMRNRMVAGRNLRLSVEKSAPSRRRQGFARGASGAGRCQAGAVSGMAVTVVVVPVAVTSRTACRH
jgi:hypothetical protein